jgi:hypothetical protein
VTLDRWDDVNERRIIKVDAPRDSALVITGSLDANPSSLTSSYTCPNSLVMSWQFSNKAFTHGGSAETTVPSFRYEVSSNTVATIYSKVLWSYSFTNAECLPQTNPSGRLSPYGVEFRFTTH